jgi:hypothetical protein
VSWILSWFYPMKPNATNPRKSGHVKVLDGRKQPIRGLWKRGENFYAQLQVDGKTTWPKLPAKTTAQAVEELNKLKVKRREGTLHVIPSCPQAVRSNRGIQAKRGVPRQAPFLTEQREGILQAVGATPWACPRGQDPRAGHYRRA